MKARAVLFIDSGIGGLPYVQAFRGAAPEASIIYLADRGHFPYGEKTNDQLVDILVKLVGIAKRRWSLSFVVIACNTASVAALEALRAAYPDLPFVGTVPAVKPAVLASARRRIGVLATERTVRDPYVRLLVDRYASDIDVLALGAPELVVFVEQRLCAASDDEREAFVRPYVDRFRDAGADALVLGCTHFLHLASEFHRLASPDILVYDSIVGVAQRAASLWTELENNNSISSKEIASTELYVTGPPPYEAAWERFSAEFRLTFKGSAFIGDKSSGERGIDSLAEVL